ncbi:hypothetical protein ACILD6_03185 [Capnocytophaga canimorsus]|uniref:hypothetical protein n=1 Tax=Capnocytophaga canimorsus TaxID=28188 RepID=UPI0037D07CDA
MRFVLLILIAFSVNLGFTQKPKQHVLRFSVWEYPKYYIDDTEIAIVSDEAVPQRCKIDFFVLRQLNFRSLQIVKPKDANYVLQIKLVQCGYETEFDRNYNPNETSGKVVMRADFHCVVKKEKEIVYDFISTHKRNVLSKTLSLNKEEFTKVVMDEVLYNDKNFPMRYDETFKKLTEDFVHQLRRDFDFALMPVSYILYSFEDKELDEITQSVQETIALFDKQQLDSKTLLAKIDFWEETASKYSFTDKKQKRIYWALMKNIAASYFFLGNYSKALMYKEKADLADYKNNESYPKRNIETIIANRLPYEKIGSVRNFSGVDFSNSQDFTNIEIINTTKLTENFAQEELPDFELKEKKVELISKLLSIDASYDFLSSLSKYAETFNDERFMDDVKAKDVYPLRDFYLSFDKTYLSLTAEVNKNIEAISVFDVSIFSDEEKVQIAEALHYLKAFYGDLYNKELITSYERSAFIGEDSERIEASKKIVDFTINWMFAYIEKGTAKEKIAQLYRQFFKYQGKDIKKIPYLDYLAYMLTNSEALNRENNFELYQKYHKEYKKIYFELFYSQDFKKIHSKDIDVLLHPAVSQYYKLAIYKPNKKEAPNFVYDENTIKKILLLLVN